MPIKPFKVWWPIVFLIFIFNILKVGNRQNIYDRSSFRQTAKGPGKLTEALEIDKESFHGLPLRLSPIWFGREGIDREKIKKRNKAGIPRNYKGFFYFR